MSLKKNYLEISRASDIQNPKERLIYRIFEILPGFLSLATLFFAFLFSWLKPAWVAVFIILFCTYYLFKICYLAFLQISSYRKMKEHLKIIWLDKLVNLRKKEDIYHLVIFPAFKEGLEIIETSLNNLNRVQYPKKKMIVVLALEERAGKKYLAEIKGIEKKYSKKFYRFLTTFHPKDIAGEISGKGSNVNFAIKEAYKKIISPLKIRSENVIVSSFDIDTQVYPQYFSCLTYHYLISSDRLKLSFQPIPVYHNNIWSSPAFSRVISTSSTFWQMMQQERPASLVTYSSHSFPLKVALTIGYPKNVVSDDSRIFWKAFLYYDGDYRVQPLYYPVSMDTVLAKSFLKTLVSQYRQQKRWAWGCSEISYLLYGFLKNKKISLKSKLFHLINILDGFWSWAVAAILILFLGWFPLLVGGEGFNLTILSYNLPRITSKIMTVALFGLIISATLNILFLPPWPKNFKKIKIASFFFQWLLLPFTLIVFGSFPALDAQIRLMFGKYMGFWNTPKIR